MNYNFNLRPPKKGGNKKAPRRIYVISNYKKDGKKQKFVYSTGFKVVPSHWNANEQRVKNVLAAHDSQTINNYLNALSVALNTLFVEMAAKRQVVTPQYLKEYLDEYHNKNTTIDEPMTFLRFISEHIQRCEDKNNVATNQKIRVETIGIYRTTLKCLQDYNKRVAVDFHTVTQSFYEKFTKHLEDKGLKVNTVGKYIKTLKAFIRAADEMGYPVVQDYKNRAFKVQREDVTNIYLTEKELNILYDMDLSQNPRLHKVRDLFLVGCYTGLRFSDFTNIKAQNISAEIDTETGEAYHVIKIETKKTGAVVTIPIHETLTNIIKRNGGAIPKNISNQKMNDYLKELCQLAGFTNAYEIGETKAGVRIQKTMLKYEMVSTHTARRSFATNQYKAGIPTITIRQITGHKTETAFLKYIKVTGDEHAQIMRTYWRAKPQSLLKAV
jgi:integrase